MVKGLSSKSLVMPVCDTKRHLVCYPYNKQNLHLMAKVMGIGRHWFHKDHYDIPKRRRPEIESKCFKVSSKEIVQIIKGGELEWLKI